MSSTSTALLLIAHGSKQTEANADLHRLGDQLRATGRYGIVVASFLELAEPNIEMGGAMCVQPGIRQVILTPYFLAAGRHVRHDLARARDRLATRFANVEFRLAEPLGPHPLLAEIVVQRTREAAIPGTPITPTASR